MQTRPSRHLLELGARLAPWLVVSFLSAGPLRGETLEVLHAEGVVRGFLVLRSTEGQFLASGDLIQTSRGDRVTSRLVFHFRDGSVQDETAVFTQRDRFRLVSDHLIQRGPTFPHPIEVSVEKPSGRVRVRARDEGGEEKVFDEAMALPDDLANGMVLTLLKNVPPGGGTTTVSMVVATPKPRLVHLVITRVAVERFSAAGAPHDATLFRVQVELGGLAGLIAPLIGKKPHDTAVWILEGDAPGFVKSEGPSYAGGPVWRIELASPVWPREAPSALTPSTPAPSPR